VGKWPSLGRQRADALLVLLTGGGAEVTSEIVLHVRGDGCTLDNGTPIAGSIVERLASNAFLRALIHDAERRPINASSRQRHPTLRQKRVIHERDRACVDCGSTDLLRYDHQPDYEQTRHTIIEEVELRCAPCHHKRHAKQAAKAAAE
jgi:5-methylcytosine-specific restriction endonuclease McrA